MWCEYALLMDSTKCIVSSFFGFISTEQISLYAVKEPVKLLCYARHFINVQFTLENHRKVFSFLENRRNMTFDERIIYCCLSLSYFYTCSFLWTLYMYVFLYLHIPKIYSCIFALSDNIKTKTHKYSHIYILALNQHRQICLQDCSNGLIRCPLQLLSSPFSSTSNLKIHHCHQPPSWPWWWWHYGWFGCWLLMIG